MFFKPLAQAVAGHPALGAYEAINEATGSVLVGTVPYRQMIKVRCRCVLKRVNIDSI